MAGADRQHRGAIEKCLANALGQDVTQLAAEEKRQLLSRLLARFAHEVRNPLSSLDVHVQLLEEDLQELPAGVRERIAGRFEIIHGELHRLETIVKHFLSLAGPSSMDLQPVEIGKIIRHVCELLRPEAETRGIGIRTHLSEGLPGFSADPGQLTQALLNLVINALQAVGQGGWVEVEARLDPSESAVLVRVRDNGPGIPRDGDSAIFEPFFTTKPQGSGLGLWIVQQVITAHGGDVDASNAPGGGACFTLRLPLHREEGLRG